MKSEDRGIDFDSIQENMHLHIKKCTHPDAEYRDIPHLEENTLYLGDSQFGKTSILTRKWFLPSSGNGIRSEMTVFVAECAFNGDEVCVRFTSLAWYPAKSFEKQLCEGIESDCLAFDIAVDDCVQIEILSFDNCVGEYFPIINNGAVFNINNRKVSNVVSKIS